MGVGWLHFHTRLEERSEKMRGRRKGLGGLQEKRRFCKRSGDETREGFLLCNNYQQFKKQWCGDQCLKRWFLSPSGNKRCKEKAKSKSGEWWHMKSCVEVNTEGTDVQFISVVKFISLFINVVSKFHSKFTMNHLFQNVTFWLVLELNTLYLQCCPKSHLFI